MEQQISTENNKKTGPFLGGAMIIASTTIGAGMFALPIESAGMWTVWTVAALVLTGFCMLCSGLLLLETNLHYPVGASFHTMTKDTLGSTWNVLNGLSLAFVGYILCYAYISGSSSMLQQLTQTSVTTQAWLGLGLAALVAVCIFWSTSLVEKLATVMIISMIISFVLSTQDMLLTINPELLFPELYQKNIMQHMPYIWVALPFLLPAFGYHHNVSSLVKHYGKSPSQIRKSLLLGTAIALSLYLAWIVGVFGHLSQSEIIDVKSKGGNISALVDALNKALNTNLSSILLTLFTNMAVLSSFLGVALGLFDYLADVFQFDRSRKGRLKTVLFTFIPPMLASFFYPNGFLMAIGFAGLAATLWAVIIPAMMAYACRQKFPSSMYQVRGGNWTIALVIGFGVLVASCHILHLFDLLPVYSN